MTSDSGKLIITQSDAEVVRLNNNMLSSWDGFSDTFHTLLLSPLQLSWIDLSFNDLKSIHAVCKAIVSHLCVSGKRAWQPLCGIWFKPNLHKG